jgi:hypothetical protein
MDEQPAQKDSSAGTDENAGYSEAGLESGDAGFGNGGDPGAGGSELEPYEDGADTGDIPGTGASSPGSESENSDVPNGTGKASTGGHEEQNDPQCVESGPSFEHSGVEMPDHLIQGADSDELTDEVRGALGSMVHSESEMPRTLGDTLKQILERISGESEGSECLRVAVVKGGLPGEMPKPLLEKAYSATKVMATRLSGLLQTQTLSRPHTGRRGRVDGTRLHRLAVQNLRVFQRPAERQGIDTAVHILLDCSSSMEECMPLANAACFSVASALRRIRGVNVGVTAFPGTWDCEEPCTVAPILKHGQRMHTRFAARAYGSTPMGEALWWTCQEMMTLKEERKIVLILTDGHPDSIPNTEAALDVTRAMGLEVIGIGIGQYGEYILKLIENSRVINGINELAPAMFGVLQQALTEKGPQ